MSSRYTAACGRQRIPPLLRRGLAESHCHVDRAASRSGDRAARLAAATGRLVRGNRPATAQAPRRCGRSGRDRVARGALRTGPGGGRRSASGRGGGAVRVVNRALAHDASPTLRLGKGNLTASAPADAQAALGRIARQAATQLAGPDPVRLRACADPTCAGIYLDESGRRRWCADKLLRCSNPGARAPGPGEPIGSPRGDPGRRSSNCPLATDGDARQGVQQRRVPGCAA